MSEPWSLFQDSDSSEVDEKDSCMEEKKNEELIIDNDDRRAFLVYFKHAQYLTFDELFRQILVCKYWYENVTRFCTHVSLKIRHDIHFSTLLSKMRPQSLSCSPYTTTATLYTLVASWRDSLEQIQMPHLHKDREYRTVLQIMKNDPVVLDLANCKASVLTLTYLGLRASRLVKLNLCVSRPGITDSLISNVLKHAPVLRFLNLSGNTNLSMRCLQGAITKTLENLSLEGLKVNGEAWRDEIIRKHRHSIRALNLSQMYVTPEERSSFVFSNLSKFTCLRTLGLARIDRRFLPELSTQLAALPNLKELDLSHTIWAKDFMGTNKKNVLRSLRVLWLRHSSIFDDELLWMTRLCPNLTDLDIGDCFNISEQGLESVLLGTSLKRLFMDRNNPWRAMKGSGLRRGLKKHADLLALSVSNHDFEENWYEHLSAKLLRLNVTWFSYLDLKFLRNRCHCLKKLVLDACDVTEYDLLSFVATWSSLRDLSLEGLDAVTDNVVLEIARQNSLYRLNIGRCFRVTLASILSVEMSRFKELQYLDIRDTSLVGGRQTRRKIMNLLPTCEILFFFPEELTLRARRKQTKLHRSV